MNKNKKKEQDFAPLPSQSQVSDPNTLIIGGTVFNVKHTKTKTGKSQKTTKTALTSQGTLLKPGRHACDCEGTKHACLTNCLTCGKIVCEQEGYGPCFYCQQHVIQPPIYKNNEDNTLSKKQKLDPDFVQALERRNRLLQYDQNFEQRTVVIDEQAADYYGDESEKNIWLDESEKLEREEKAKRIKELREKNELKSKQSIRYIFDFAGRRVLLDESEKEKDSEQVKNLMNDLKTSSAKSSTQLTNENVRPLHPALQNIAQQLKYVSDTKSNKDKPVREASSKTNWGRLQDHYFVVEDVDEEEALAREQAESTVLLPDEEPEVQYEEPISTKKDDKCMVMSMHQPWASLLIHGIKRHEGRYWNSNHRGRLWIASTSQEPTKDEIEEVEQMYRNEPYNRTKGYPRHFPTSVVLGCVDVVDVLPQNQYKEKFTKPDENESQSEFVFICKNPRKLVVPLPISGRPKIYPLPKELVKGCQSGLRKLPPPFEHIN
jgi:hypothetical protein